ncbi:GTP cyclohydrolase 1 type 2 [Austwickia sp. TVS 96-490-7B]|uniref:Nif3-like dinuclear metal center hexameric protein n=1 Tax=Austwickia sp. TVS 96-490-7B TaxID=2830843 RepID=UPI001C568712|nr:Nif3-like dinuclear metal center hexameric protein [Austwickia sp. TVS 96-490-7B]MBW3086431.1 GTP cyclohydrolase 1 type 2 [Austwickia sp. TVS 96-490-7B]
MSDVPDHAVPPYGPSGDAPGDVLLRDVLQVIEELYPKDSAQSWDRVGVVTGDLDQPIRRIHLAVDPTLEVIEEARAAGADLLMTHHPLLLRGVHSLATHTAKGAAVTALIVADMALVTAHTNADVAEPGVCTALAQAAGVTQMRPLTLEEGRPMGRIGSLGESISLAEFASRLASALPATPVGVRVSGPPQAPVTTVAVVGGAGDSLLDEVRRSGADVYVTADLRHHPVVESREESRGGPPYLVDAGHFATEWLWLEEAGRRIIDGLGPRGAEVDTFVSRIITDPWTFVVGTAGPDDVPGTTGIDQGGLR